MTEVITSPIQEVVRLEVENGGGDRLDRWLSLRIPAMSRSRLQKLIDQGHVFLNGSPCPAKSVVVHRGDRLVIRIPEAIPLEVNPEPIPLDVLYEDDHLVIVNKPAGLVVHPAPGHLGGTLVNALLAHCQNLSGIGGVQRPGIVHRLDKDTSGAIAVAKTDQACAHIQAQLRHKTARREYLGVVFGAPRTQDGTVDQPIGRHPVDRKKKAIVTEEQGGRRAVTHWQVRERLGNYTLMHFRLETGRTHQIRVHSAHLGHPVVGDPMYSSGRSPGVNLKGQALHAWKLTIQHPVTEQSLEAIAPPPPEFETLLTVLRRQMP